MAIPVLFVAGKQDVLAKAVRAFVERQPFEGFDSANVPDGLTLDLTFPPVPLPEAGVEDLVGVYKDPQTASRFVVRCFAEVSDPSEIIRRFPKHQIFADPRSGVFPICGDHPAIGNTGDVQVRLGTGTLAAKGLDGNNVAIAIVDSGIAASHLAEKRGAAPNLDSANSWRPGNIATDPGNQPFDHGTMCAYDALLVAPKATLLDYPMLLTRSGRDEHTVAATVSAAMTAFARLLVDWAVTQRLQYNALVVSNSWGIYHQSLDFPIGSPARYTDNLAHPFHLLVAGLASTGVDIVFAAGNCGSDCPGPPCLGVSSRTIWGANGYREVLTVAGCDVTDHRVGYSSRGPSIFNFPKDKPDLTAYTHFLGSEVEGDGEPDAGTSAACPIAAGCVAALRTNLAMSPRAGGPAPSVLFNQFKANARPAPGTPAGWNPEYGHGIIDPVATATSLGL